MSDKANVKTILACTVGGSHQPILAAIESLRPGFVVFFCTGRDPETGRPGSREQIEGRGSVISAGRGEPPSLPNIPVQAGLEEDRYEVVEIPADDMDAAAADILEALGELRRRWPEARMVADYTGGTKSMTAALVVAALESEGVELQLVTGARADLVRVADGTQYAVPASVERIRLRRRMAPFLDAWKRHAYDEAAAGLGAIPAPAQTDLRAELNLAASLSRGLAAWDRFDHAAALESLDPYRPRIGKALGFHMKALEMLNEQEGERREAVRLYDLWLNARRRAVQGRCDDAVARLYRLLEWTAQWQLRRRAGIETADVPPEKIPPGFQLSPNREGKYQAGLYQAWLLLGEAAPGTPPAQFIEARGNELLDILRIRNHSILAHGFEPIGTGEWDRIDGWAQERFLPLLTDLAGEVGVRFDPERMQLPRELPR